MKEYKFVAITPIVLSFHDFFVGRRRFGWLFKREIEGGWIARFEGKESLSTIECETIDEAKTALIAAHKESVK